MVPRTWAVVVPMANEEQEFAPFIGALGAVMDGLGSGSAYIVVDRVSRDRTLDLCRELSARDRRFRTIWAPENRSVVDAYLGGFREALRDGHDFVIEMDAGLSHDPRALPLFIERLQEGYDCVFGSRFLPGGSMEESNLWRRFLSRGGTFLANLLLGTELADMTSGFQGFRAGVVARLLDCRLRSTAHFYQTEVRYLMRNCRVIEIPIHYRAPSPRVSRGAIANALGVLAYYAWQRFTGRAPAITPTDTHP